MYYYYSLKMTHKQNLVFSVQLKNEHRKNLNKTFKIKKPHSILLK